MAGILPVDVHAVQIMPAHQFHRGVGETGTRGLAGGGLGEIARAPAAHRQHDLQIRIVLAQRGQPRQRSRCGLAKKEHLVLRVDVGEGEVDDVELARADGRELLAIGDVADHPITRIVICLRGPCFSGTDGENQSQRQPP